MVTFATLATVLSRAAQVAAVVVALLAVATQAVVRGPSEGDIAIWLFVHEWLSRGATLYDDVFDHKDWGFFALHAPFYAIDSTRGIYIAGALFTLAFGAGAFLVLRQFASHRFAVIGASVMVLAYVLSPSYLSTYNENASIALAVLAAGLAARSPAIAGIVFAVSCSVKVSGVVLFVSVLGTVVLLDWVGGRGRPLGDRLTRGVRLISGFIVGAAVITLSAAASGVLPGWIGVVDFNREYAAIRLANTGADTGVLTWLRVFVPPADVRVALGVLAACVVIGLVAAIVSRRWERAVPTRSDDRMLVLAVTVAFAVAAFAALAVQNPPQVQHYQYFIAPVILLVGALAGVLWSAAGRLGAAPRRGAGALAVVLLVAPVVAHSGVVVGERPLGVRAAMDQWADVSSPGPLAPFAAALAPGDSVAVIGWNGLIDLSDAPADITLACRHFFHYPQLLPRYGNEIEDCLARSMPDIYFVSDERYRGDEYTALVDRVLEIINETHVECGPTGTQYRIWAHRGEPCPTPRSLP